MDRKKIINMLFEHATYSEEQKKIITALEEAKMEWESAAQCFQMVNEPTLVDYAIHQEDAAKAKYIFFLSKARENGITLDASYMIEELTAGGN